jgi:hypothetical protein
MHFLSLLFIVVLTTGTSAMAIEKAKYRILESEGDFELRSYEPSIVAETVVEGDFDVVANEGFRRLAAYINGNNRKEQSISMTAPVTQEAGSEKISMTAPVSQERVGRSWRITFLMPSKYTMETLPEPLDERVVLKKVPGRLMAAIRYSGTWSRKRYEEKRALLMEWVQKRGWRTLGEPVWARYDPPFMPWFLRRNEVLIAVEESSQ